MQTKIIGNNNVTVDASNRGLDAAIIASTDDAGSFVVLGESDDGEGFGVPKRRKLQVKNDRKTRVSFDTFLFDEKFPGTILNTSVWNAPVTTMTVTQTNGSANLNAGLSVAVNGTAILYSKKCNPFFGFMSTSIEQDVALVQPPLLGNVCEWGAFVWTSFPATSTVIVTNGVFWRVEDNGNIHAVICYNGQEIKSQKFSFEEIFGMQSKFSHFATIITDRSVSFFVNDLLKAEIRLTDTGLQGPIFLPNLPITFRTFNRIATSTAQVMKVGAVSFLLNDSKKAKNWSHILCGAGYSGYLNQTGSTAGQTVNYANSANPTAAVMTNTTAALGTGLGGQFWETYTLTAGTDGIVCSYQVPVGTAALPGKCLYIYGVEIQSYVQTALTGGGCNDQFVLCFGHTAVSLATTESSTTKAPRRIPLGTRRVSSAEAVLTELTTIKRTFISPICVNQGEFVAITRKTIGTAASAGVIAHTIMFNAHFE